MPGRRTAWRWPLSGQQKPNTSEGVIISKDVVSEVIPRWQPHDCQGLFSSHPLESLFLENPLLGHVPMLEKEVKVSEPCPPNPPPPTPAPPHVWALEWWLLLKDSSSFAPGLGVGLWWLFPGDYQSELQGAQAPSSCPQGGQRWLYSLHAFSVQ